MEIKLKNKKDSKTIKIDNSIVSLDSSSLYLLNNLTTDYNPVIVRNTDLYFKYSTVLNEITNYAKFPELSVVMEVLAILGLDNSFIDKNVLYLSETEKIFLNILRNIARLNDIIIFEDPFLGLDNTNQKKIVKLISFLKEKKYIPIIMGDVDKLYRYADLSIVASDKEIIVGKTDEIYTDVKTLINNKLDVPTLSYITFKAKEEKNIKLFYSKDIRDIIKDIYKHV